MTDINEFNEVEGITPSAEETLNNEPVIEEIPESEIIPNPWDDAPSDVYFYEKIYDDGHLGSFTQSAELAYKAGWDLSQYIVIDEVQQSDINGWYYPKDQCPMKSESDLQKEAYQEEIVTLKKQLSDTDYKAIKYAEGMLTDEEYAEVKEQRQGWRDRINELESLCGN